MSDKHLEIAAATLFDTASHEASVVLEERRRTIERFAAAWGDMFGGRNLSDESIANKMTLFPSRNSDHMVLVKDIRFYTFCEHHMIPFFGRVHIAYLPDSKIVGLSKFVRVAELVSKRLQVQEHYTNTIANIVESRLKPRGVAVVSHARHMCMEMRGVSKPGSITVCSDLRGAFRDSKSLRSELFSNINSELVI